MSINHYKHSTKALWSCHLSCSVKLRWAGTTRNKLPCDAQPGVVGSVAAANLWSNAEPGKRTVAGTAPFSLPDSQEQREGIDTETQSEETLQSLSLNEARLSAYKYISN